MKRFNQSGMISLVICMILMIVISLMTLSFATLSRREQRQALDKQLSTQAFYAAETGVNDAIKAISDNPNLGEVTECSESEQAKINPSGVPDDEAGLLNTDSNVSRTCVLIDQSPSQIDGVVGESSSTVYPISATGLESLDIYWENDSAVSVPVFPAISAAGSFPRDDLWDINSPGVLAIQLIPFPVGGTNRTNIASGTKYLYGFPTEDNSPQTANSGTANGTILRGDCSASNLPRQCKVTITNLSGQYYIRLRAFYDPVHVTLEARSSSGRVSFEGAQLVIDSTGRANDITKRIKIYKSLRASSSLPSSVLEIGDDLCKRLLSNPVDTTTDNLLIPSCSPTYP